MTRSNPNQEPDRLEDYRAGEPQGSSAADQAGAAEFPETPTDFTESSAVKRARHLDLLREAVDSGAYRADPGKIAESMLDNERS